MLSVVEQRAGRWGLFSAAENSAAETQQASAGDDHSGAYIDGNLSGDAQSPVDVASYDLPSVTMLHRSLSSLRSKRC